MIKNTLNTLILLFLATALAFAGNQSNPQILERKITIQVKNENFKNLLNSIGKIAGVTFAYNTKDIPKKSSVNLDIKEKALKDVLDDLLGKFQLTYTLYGNQVIIKKKTTSEIKRRIEGAVLDFATGRPLPGVNIIVEAEIQGTLSDSQGKFVLFTEEMDSITLVFSYIGYNTQRISLGTQTFLQVLMKPELYKLEEIVVVGYGFQKKKDITGAIASITNQDAKIESKPITTMEQVLQGQLAGVSVLQNSGVPGTSVNLRVRGITSINAGNDPLYVLDGVPVNIGNYSGVAEGAAGINTLSNLNPNDVESIEVLKDASAAAIYGSRASNGVVLITTKRGEPNQNLIKANIYYGWQKAWKKLPLLAGPEYGELINESRQNNGLNKTFNETSTLPTTDWQEAIFQTTPIQHYELSSSGGTEKTLYFLSGSYSDQKGIILGSGFERYSVRMNIDQKPKKKLQYGINLGLNRSIVKRIRSGSSGVLGTATRKAPTLPVYNSDDTFFSKDTLNPNYENPVALATIPKHTVFNNRVIGNIYVEYNLFKDLKFRTSLGIDFLSLTDDFTIDKNNVLVDKRAGISTNATTQDITWINENTLSYKKKYLNHDISMVAGFSQQESKFSRSVSRGEIFAAPGVSTINSAAINNGFGDKSGWGLISYFGRINYGFNNKYLLGISYRVDGSSRFSKNHKYGSFPAFSGGWRMSEEDFMKGISFINELKIRGSWGVTGNQNIDNFKSRGLSFSGENYLGLNGIAPRQIENADLTWETTTQTNFGLDLTIFQNRLSLTTDLYSKKTDGLLLDVELPLSSGFNKSTRNVGNIENKGFEIQLKSNNIATHGLQWLTNFNLSFNRNKITHLPPGDIISGFFDVGSILREGYPIGSFYGWKITGIDPETGNYIFFDKNGDNNTPLPTAEDRVIIGSPHPDFTGGITNDLSFKGFEISAFLQFVHGNQIFNGSKYYNEAMSNYDNGDINTRNRWKSGMETATLHKAMWTDPHRNAFVSDRAIEDGSFLRFKILTLAYNFQSRFLEKIKMSTLRIYVTTQNLFTWTKYSGFDPEVNSYETDINMGFDRNTYPQARSFICGINIGI